MGPYDIKGYDRNVRYNKRADGDVVVTAAVGKTAIEVSDGEGESKSMRNNKLLDEIFLADGDREGPLAVNEQHVVSSPDRIVTSPKHINNNGEEDEEEEVHKKKLCSVVITVDDDPPQVAATPHEEEE